MEIILSARICFVSGYWVIPEKIHLPPTEEINNTPSPGHPIKI